VKFWGKFEKPTGRAGALSGVTTQMFSPTDLSLLKSWSEESSRLISSTSTGSAFLWFCAFINNSDSYLNGDINGGYSAYLSLSQLSISIDASISLLLHAL